MVQKVELPLCYTGRCYFQKDPECLYYFIIIFFFYCGGVNMCVGVCVFVQSGCVLEMLRISVTCLVCFVLLTLLLVRRFELRMVAI